MNRRVLTVLLAVCALVLAGPAAPGTAPRWHHWLCLPGRADSCRLAPTVTVVSASGSRVVKQVTAATSPPVDCFYLYPTVSDQKRGNSTLDIEWAEAGIAIAQASEFSRVCRVYAPMYRQVTIYGNGDPYHGNYAFEYDDAVAAWRDYLAHYNHGRGVVLIGHSEGSFLFKQLIRKEIEGTAEQKQLVSAILLGGDVQVENGSIKGGDLSSVPACTSAAQTGCVVAYSSWNRTPPGDASFQSVGNSSEHVLCVNPAAPGSTKAVPITPLFPNFAPQGLAPFVKEVRSIVWYEFPGLYTARCVRQGARAWLLVTRIHHSGDRRPTVQPIFGPRRGLHAADVNVDLENLIALVASQSRVWQMHR